MIKRLITKRVMSAAVVIVLAATGVSLSPEAQEAISVALVAVISIF